MGEQFVEWACSVSDAWHLIGVELYKPGIGAMLSKADKLGLSNLSFIDQPIQAFLSDIASEGIDEVRIFFPDPWPKKKHAKRRLINTEFVDELSKKMAAGASLTIATDWEQYALEITSIIDASSAFILKEDAADSSFPRKKWEVATLDKQNLRREASVLDIVFGISHTQKQRRSRVRRRSEGSSQDTYSLIPSSCIVQAPPSPFQ